MTEGGSKQLALVSQNAPFRLLGCHGQMRPLLRQLHPRLDFQCSESPKCAVFRTIVSTWTEAERAKSSAKVYVRQSSFHKMRFATTLLGRELTTL